VNLATEVTGILPAANGGTGVNNAGNTLTLSGGSVVVNGAARLAWPLSLTVPSSAPPRC